MEEEKFNYIYFNFTHDKLKEFKINLSQEYKGFETLEKIDEKEINQLSGPLINKVYRFKINKDWFEEENVQNEFKIDVLIEDENQAQYKYTIRFNDTNKDFYEYNFKIEEIDVLSLRYEQQFDIYVEVLRKKYKKQQKDKENEDFILSTRLLFEEKNKKYDFLFYLLIFLECFSCKVFQKYLLLFNPEKIKGMGEVPESKFKLIKNILNSKAKKPEGIHFESEETKQETIELFCSIVLYFNLHFQKEKVAEMFENKTTYDYLYKKLIDFRSFFKDLILEKKDVITLLEKAKDFDQILNFLFYLGKDFLQFIEVLIETKDLIMNKIKDENNENKEIKKAQNSPIIDIGNM